MTVSELIDQLKDCAPNAEVTFLCYVSGEYVIAAIETDGEHVVLS